MFITRLKLLREKGDTLIEVMIAMSVISLVLGGAYVMTNTSLQASRDAQERVNATKLAQSQLELLKSIASSKPTQLFSGTFATGSGFCIDQSGNPIVDTNSACKVNANGTPSTTPPTYSLSIKQSPANNFTLTTTWTNSGGQRQEVIHLKYRVYN